MQVIIQVVNERDTAWRPHPCPPAIQATSRPRMRGRIEAVQGAVAVLQRDEHTAAWHDAIRQKGLMTNWPLRRRIDSVATTKRQVTLDVLAPHGRPAGMTARFTLRFRTSGHARKRVTVTGRLFLTRNAHGLWRIFGYDVSKGAK